MKTSNEIRKQFLDYFSARQHEIVRSAPIVAKDDPTLLFTNAGMNQFKDNFLGIKAPAAPRLADTQKCLRASGKHNDLDEVGHDTYHHTMFEMLGNWSFGDYYKAEAIEWGWDLLTNVYGIDPDLIYVTVFGGDADDNLGEDAEAVAEWQKWIGDDRILRFDKKDNFWEMGEVGPCGPCSEIHIDLRRPEEKAKVPGAELVNADHPEVIEIWNLVFMEFNRKADKSLVPLPAKCVDTGMGLERLVMALQGVKSNYDTDLFRPYIDFLEREYGAKYGRSEEETIAMRVVMDHIRAIAFSITDGQAPSNNKAGYVIRRILRRASRYAFTFLGINVPFLYRLVPVLAEIYRDTFPEVGQQQEYLGKLIEEEEKSFLRTLERGTQLFDEYLRERAGGERLINGAFAFKLYDTYGFPSDLTRIMAEEKGWQVDVAGFNAEMQKQKDRAREAGEVQTGDWVEISALDDLPVFTGYDTLEGTARIMRYRTLETKKKNKTRKVYQLVLDTTPFYAESGGQIGDTGTLRKGDAVIRILDTKKENELIVHEIDRLPEFAEGDWEAQVDPERRRRIKANHSATHLVHAALREVLGQHVEQRGSLVSDALLRFDFSHFQKMTEEEITRVEEIVNARIAEGIALDERRAVPIAEAKELGAMMLFGEKYGDQVRVIVFDPEFSIELCGGTHVTNTHEIRLFKIASEGSISAGVRRIEAYTSDRALAYLGDNLATLEQIRALLKQSQDPAKAVAQLIDSHKALEKELQKLQQAQVGQLKEGLLARIKAVGNFRLLAEVVDVPSGKELKSLAFDLRKDRKNTVIVLGMVNNGKPMLNVAITADLESAGTFNAGQLIRELAAEIGGKGGGQAGFAAAGGRDAEGFPKVMAKALELLEGA
ncbi:MAG: alanine--tRNA ligase [Bacteroidota bacterium]